MPDRSYDQLAALSHELQLVADSSALLSWDQEVLLPSGGVAYRAEQMAWFSGYLHERFTTKQVGDWISEAELEVETAVEKAAVREWRHRYDRATRLPKRLVEEISSTQTLAKAAWANAREKSDFSAFAPTLERLVALTREKAELFGYEDELYDALVDEFERGSSTAKLRETLGELRTRLIPVVEAATRREKFDATRLSGHYPIAAQQAFNREVAESIGFEFDAGRIDTAVHPFCSGMGPRDVRLTTRYDEQDFRSSLFGVLHEAGHGLYEQGLAPELRSTPVGHAVSLGVHESQSRLWENHVGRSRAFWEKWLPQAVNYFPNLESMSLDDMVEAVNQAELSYIRVESDEVTYDLHILLRFEMEQAIFAGDLAIKDVPGEWNRRFEEYFGLPVDRDANGCLQDIHWSMGIFGYFPTYSLGNLNAAHLAKAAREQDSAVAEGFETGDFLPLLGWMREKIHQVGSEYLPDELVERAAGTPVTANALIEHLEARYLP
ncbi:MAG: carboxypeptidase M32 [Verrucomicrobiota bacterium]